MNFSKFSFSFLFGFLSLLFFFACETAPQSSSSEDPSLPLSADLRYQAIVGITGVPISESSPVWDDLAAVPTATYRIEPDLPIGLTLNTSTGTISGKPSAASPSADYTVTATGTGSYTGSSSARLVISIASPLAESLRYQAINGLTGVLIPETSPIWDDLSAIPTATYRIEPELPNGLILNTSTGTISGKPTAVLLSADYTVTATGTGNYTGSSSAQFTINITTPLAESFRYQAIAGVKEVAISETSPIWDDLSAIPTATYRIEPELPNGLTFNTSTGTISGKPTAVLLSADYMVTATGTGSYTGSKTSTIVIEVRDAAEFSYARVAYGTSDTRSPVFTWGTASDGTFRITTSGNGSVQPTLPKIDETTGTITIDSTTTAGTYMVMFSENTEATPFYVTKQPETISTLESALEIGIKYFGLEADFNYLQTEFMTSLVGVFAKNYKGGRTSTGKPYIEDFNGDISLWNVSNVTTMETMFRGARKFNKDIGSWNVSKVSNMASMFYEASNFNKDISNWDVSNVINMNYMFFGAANFNQKIGNWTVNNVKNMSYMFFEAANFNQDINKWQVSKVITMAGMFNGATEFNGDVSAWVVDKVADMSYMFFRTEKFNSDISGWKVVELQKITKMFSEATAFDKDLEDWKKYFTLDVSTGKAVTITKTDAFTSSKLEANNKLPSWY